MQTRAVSRPFFSTILIFVLVTVLLVLGCNYVNTIGGKNIVVEFRRADSVKGGEKVYAAGVVVGVVSGKVAVTNGVARVPVSIFRQQKAAIPSGTVFLLTTDQGDPSNQCLVAYTSGSNTAVAQAGAEVYSGATNLLELSVLVGAEKAKELFKSVGK